MSEYLKERNHSEDPGVNKSIQSECIFMWEGVEWIHVSRQGPVASSSVHGNEPEWSMKVEEFFD